MYPQMVEQALREKISALEAQVADLTAANEVRDKVDELARVRGWYVYRISCPDGQFTMHMQAIKGCQRTCYYYRDRQGNTHEANRAALLWLDEQKGGE